MSSGGRNISRSRCPIGKNEHRVKLYQEVFITMASYLFSMPCMSGRVISHQVSSTGHYEAIFAYCWQISDKIKIFGDLKANLDKLKEGGFLTSDVAFLELDASNVPY